MGNSFTYFRKVPSLLDKTGSYKNLPQKQNLPTTD